MFSNSSDYSYVGDFVNYLLMILDKIMEFFAMLSNKAAAADETTEAAEEGAEG